MSDHPLPDLLVEVEWNAPSAVRVRAGQLEWKRGRELVADFPHPEDVGDSLLDGFVALEHASDDDIAAYARQYGVLRLCPHAHPAPYGRPTCHVPDCPGVRDPASSRGWFTEPIDGWRQWAARLRAWRRLFEDVRLERIITDDRWDADWQTILGQPLHHAIGRGDHDDTPGPSDEPGREEWRAQPGASPRPRWVAAFRTELARVLNSWVRQAGLAPVVRWRGTPRPTNVLGHNGLFAYLVASLAQFATIPDGTAICSNCGRRYMPARKVRPDRRNYCPDPECRQRAKWRHANHTRRSKGEPT